MFGLGSSRRSPRHHTATTHTERTHGHRSTFYRKNPDRQAAGYKAALANPNTTHAGREHAKDELKAMGRGREAHVPLSTRIKRLVGVRSRPHSTTAGTTRTTRTRRY